MRHLCFLLAAVLVAPGCSGGHPGVSTPPPAPLSAEQIQLLADLLQAEDRREQRSISLPASATSAQPLLRARAAHAAGRIGGAANRRLVRRLFEDRDTSVAAAAAFALGQLRDTASVPLLLASFDSASLYVRPTVATEAAFALGLIGTQTARAGLTRLLSSARPESTAVRPAVEQALIGAWRAGESRHEPFARWLHTEAESVRWRAAYVLARLPRAETVPLLMPLLTDSSDLVRSAALRGLNHATVSASAASPDDALEQIIKAVDDPSYEVRVEAIRTLGSYPLARAFDRLAMVLERGTAHEMVAAIESIARWGERGHPLAESIRHLALDELAPVHIRGVAMQTLPNIMGPGALPIFRELLQAPHWRIRAAAAQGLAQIGREGEAELVELVRDPDSRVAAAAIQATLDSTAADRAELPRSVLLEVLESPDVHVRAAALRGLQRDADESLLPLFLDAYAITQSDRDNEAAIAALEALAALRSQTSLAPERAFFARFEAPTDPRLRRRAVALFPEAAPAAWRAALPVRTRVGPPDYTLMAEQWVGQPQDAEAPRVIVETRAGPIELALYAHAAPLTVLNFVDLVRNGYFDGQEWARVVPNFVVQGGDPRGDTSGGPGYTIRDEVNRWRYQAGTVGMALAYPGTGGSQFFITHSPQPHLAGTYTAFGQVVSGENHLEDLLPGDSIFSVRMVDQEP